MVVDTVLTQNRLADPLPQRARRDPLQFEAEPGWCAEPGITKDTANQVVAQNFGPEGADCDGCLRLGGPATPGRLIGVPRVEVFDGR